MDNPGVIEGVRVREVTGVFQSRAAIISAVDDLLLAGFDRADIDVSADGSRPGNQIDGIAVPAVELADIPEAPRQEFVAPEDTAAIFALCATVIASFGAMTGALFAVASRGSTALIIYSTVVGAIFGCGLGILAARLMGWRWIQASDTLANADGLVLWVRIRTPGREQKAMRILQLRGAEAVRVHEIENDKRVEDIPLSSLRPDPWLSDERLGSP